MRVHVLVEGEPGVVVSTDDLVMEGVGIEQLVDAAVAASRSADRVELCGGVGADDAARVVEAVGDHADVRVNRYGFESLEQVAAYKQAFADGDASDAAFLHSAPITTPLVAHPGILVAGVADDAALVAAAREAQARGVGIIELYGGLGVRAAAIVRDATDHQVPVGFVD